MPATATETTKNFLNESFGYLNTRFERQKRELVECYGVEKVVVMWECKWRALVKEKDDSLDHLSPARFVAAIYSARPKERLVPRVALRGGRVDAFALHWCAPENPDESLSYVDFNSL